MEEAPSKEVRDYLNQLTHLKMSIKQPITFVEDGDLNHVIDGNGSRVFSCSEKILEIFKEL